MDGKNTLSRRPDQREELFERRAALIDDYTCSVLEHPNPRVAIFRAIQAGLMRKELEIARVSSTVEAETLQDFFETAPLTAVQLRLAHQIERIEVIANNVDQQRTVIAPPARARRRMSIGPAAMSVADVADVQASMDNR